VYKDDKEAYTRDGGFRLNKNGDIVTKQGYRLEPGITISQEATGVFISTDGMVTEIVQGVQQMKGQIQLHKFINPDGLKAVGNNLFVETAESGSPSAGNPSDSDIGLGKLRQGFLEQLGPARRKKSWAAEAFGAAHPKKVQEKNVVSKKAEIGPEPRMAPVAEKQVEPKRNLKKKSVIQKAASVGFLGMEPESTMECACAGGSGFLGVDPGDDDAHNKARPIRARPISRDGALSDTIELYMKELEKDPSNACLKADLRKLLEVKGELAAALLLIKDENGGAQNVTSRFERISLELKAGDAKKALELAGELLTELKSKAPLALKNLTFTTRVQAFGVYDERKSDTFRPGELFQLYFEIVNFAQEKKADGFSADFTIGYRILDEDGSTRYERKTFDTVRFTTKSRLGDLNLCLVDYVPANLPKGAYTLQVFLTDHSKKYHRKAGADVSIRVKK
jgi:hypothetical protein